MISPFIHSALMGCCVCRCFREVESVAYIQHALTATTHNGFPVVRGAPGVGPQPLPVPMPSGDGGEGRGGALQGLVLRSQLLVLLEEKVRKPSILNH